MRKKPISQKDIRDVDVFEPFKDLWTSCENCETPIYKQDAKNNQYICKYCGFHIRMESSDRLDLLIDPGTWDPKDENLVSIDPYEILRNKKISNQQDEERKKAEISENNDKLKNLIELVSKDLMIVVREDEDEEYESSTERLSTEESSKDESTTDTERLSTEESSKDESTTEEPKIYTLGTFLQEHFIDQVELIQKLKEKNYDEDTETNTEKESDIRYIDTETDTEKESNIPHVDTETDTEKESDIPYVDKVDSNQRKTGLTEAVQTGLGQLDHIPVAIAVMDFEFFGGSMGSVVGEKITRLIEYAANNSLPLIISCASGGARMQEGSFSLIQMAKISSVLLNSQLFNNLFLVSILTTPTTGGVTASFGMLGNIIIGEPDACIAFAGKIVIEEVMKILVPEGVQEAEYFFEKGSLDSIVPRFLIKGVLSELLRFHGFGPKDQPIPILGSDFYKRWLRPIPSFKKYLPFLSTEFYEKLLLLSEEKLLSEEELERIVLLQKVDFFVHSRRPASRFCPFASSTIRIDKDFLSQNYLKKKSTIMLTNEVQIKDLSTEFIKNLEIQYFQIFLQKTLQRVSLSIEENVLNYSSEYQEYIHRVITPAWVAAYFQQIILISYERWGYSWFQTFYGPYGLKKDSSSNNIEELKQELEQIHQKGKQGTLYFLQEYFDYLSEEMKGFLEHKMVVKNL